MKDLGISGNVFPYWIGSIPRNHSNTFSTIVTFKNPDLRKDIDSFKQFAKQYPDWCRVYAKIDGFCVAEKEFAYKKILGSVRNQEIVPTGIISPGEYFIWLRGEEMFPTNIMVDWETDEWNNEIVCLFRDMVIGFPQTFSAGEGFFRDIGTTMLYPPAPARKESAGPILLEKEDLSLYGEFDVDSPYIPLYDCESWALSTMKDYFDARKHDVMGAMRDLAVDESISFSDLNQHLFFGESWMILDRSDLDRLMTKFQHDNHPYHEIDDYALRGIHVTDGDNYEKGVAALRGLMAKALLYPRFEEEVHYLEKIFDTYTTVPQELLAAGAALKFTIADVNAALTYVTEEDITKVKRRIQGLDWVR